MKIKTYLYWILALLIIFSIPVENNFNKLINTVYTVFYVIIFFSIIFMEWKEYKKKKSRKEKGKY